MMWFISLQAKTLRTGSSAFAYSTATQEQPKDLKTVASWDTPKIHTLETKGTSALSVNHKSELLSIHLTCLVLTYTSCGGEDLWGSELGCAGQIKRGVITKAQHSCHTLTVGSRGVQPNKYSLTPVGYRYIEPAGLPGGEGRGGCI